MSDEEILKRLEALIDTTTPDELDNAIWDWFYELKASAESSADETEGK
jgi:hypothetical protein